MFLVCSRAIYGRPDKSGFKATGHRSQRPINPRLVGIKKQETTAGACREQLLDSSDKIGVLENRDRNGGSLFPTEMRKAYLTGISTSLSDYFLQGLAPLHKGRTDSCACGVSVKRDRSHPRNFTTRVAAIFHILKTAKKENFPNAQAA